MNPILLWCCLAPSANEIVSVMKALQHSTPCLGDWCVYGCLDPALCSGSGLTASYDERRELLSLEREKLEKSALSFLLNHQLLWSPDDSGNHDLIPVTHFHDEFHSPRFSGAGYSSMSSMQQSLQLQDFSASAKPCDFEGDKLETPEWHADGPPDSRVSNLQVPPLEAELGTKDSLWHAEGFAEGSSLPDRPIRSSNEEDFVLTHILGTPQTALSLLLQVQQFQQRAMSDNPTGENYALLPSELVSVPPISPGAPADVAIARAAKKVLDEQKQETFFFYFSKQIDSWLVALRELTFKFINSVCAD